MPAPTDRPSGALVTGASSGIGRATALRLADDGIPVVLTGRSAEVLEELASECRSRGGTASVVEVDVRDEDAVNRAVGEAAQTYGRGFVVIHSAAVVAYGLFEEVPSEVLARGRLDERARHHPRRAGLATGVPPHGWRAPRRHRVSPR